jgi:TIR domain
MAQETQSAFFSYSRDDTDFVLKLAKDLKAAGAAVWLDQLDIRPGDHWDSAVETAVENCPTMLLVLSPSSVSSPNVMDEVSLAIDKRKLIIPILYRTCNIPLRLRRVQYIDARAEHATTLEELLQLLVPGPKSRENWQPQKPVESERTRPMAEPQKPHPFVNPAPQKSRLVYWIAAIPALALGWGIWHSSTPSSGTSAVQETSATAATPSAMEWVKTFLAAWDDPNVGNLRPFFDETIKPYFSWPTADWVSIEKDRKYFHQHYPNVTYTPIGEPRDKSLSKDTRVVEIDRRYFDGQEKMQHLSIYLHFADGKWMVAGIRDQ